MSISVGEVYLFYNPQGEKALNIYGDYPRSGLNVCSYTADYSRTQWWTLKNCGNGKYKLACAADTSLVLDRYRGSSALNNADLSTDASADDNDQFIEIEEVAGEPNVYRIKLASENLYLTAVDTNNGTGSGKTSTSSGNVYFAASGASAYQKWYGKHLFSLQVVAERDINVIEAQNWLNETFDAGLEVTGRTGTVVMQALVWALQKYLGMPETQQTGVFGDATMANCPDTIQSGSDSTIVKLLQYGLLCKGYDCGSASGTYSGFTTTAVKAVQEDAGVPATGIVTPRIFQAILNTDSLVLDTTNGTEIIRGIQQTLNSQYYDEWKIIPCNGIYGRETNQLLIYALQRTEHLPEDVASGSFGNTTKTHCPTIPYSGVETSYDGTTYTTAEIEKFVYLLQYALHCNGYLISNFSGEYNPMTESKVEACARDYLLPEDGKASIAIWMALLTSKGDTDRPSTACDAATQLTPAMISALVSNGYETIGRYLTGKVGQEQRNKYLSNDEILDILDGGMTFFPIYQDSNPAMENYVTRYFTTAQAQNDAQAAYNAAISLGLPDNTTIYFAVDCDVTDTQVTNYIIPFFGTLNADSTLVSHYKIGIYGTRNTCQRVVDMGLATSAFLSDMSTGYAGNLGFKLPDCWDYDQFWGATVPYTGGTLEIDKVVKNTNAPEVTTVITGNWVSGGAFSVNNTNNPIPVYSKRDMPNTDVVRGYINPHDFFVASYFPNDDHGAGSTLNIQNVLFRNASGKLDTGWINRANGGYTKYGLYSSDGNNLIENTAVSINGVDCYPMTLAAAADVLSVDGEVIYSQLPAGSIVASNDFAPDPVTGLKMHVAYLKQNNNWVSLEGYIDAKLTDGVSPTNRLLR